MVFRRHSWFIVCLGSGLASLSACGGGDPSADNPWSDTPGAGNAAASGAAGGGEGQDIATTPSETPPSGAAANQGESRADSGGPADSPPQEPAPAVPVATPEMDGPDPDPEPAAGDVPAGGEAPDVGVDPSSLEVINVRLVPRAEAAGATRVNVAVPFAAGDVAPGTPVAVRLDGVDLPARSRELSQHADGSVRSLQVQTELPVAQESEIDVVVGAAPDTSLELVPVESTLAPADGTQGPNVWALLPAEHLAQSGIAGPQVPASEIAGTELDVWDALCDYEANDVESFIAQRSKPDVWLYDTATVSYRGHARRGDLVTLESGYRGAALYRAALSGSGGATRIGVPDRIDDLKYHYSQGMAIHYLMTGDDRFRESAEGVAARANALWAPEFGGNLWTERHAGFRLLANVWAAVVSDDRSDQFWQEADRSVEATLAVLDAAPAGPGSPEARCFVHDGDQCSPWMSAIVADGLDAYASERPGPLADRAREAIVQLGRMLARAGRDPSGKPYYMLYVSGGGEVDDYDEHWGESAYVAAMAWHHSGRSEPELYTAAEQLVAGLSREGSAPHLRSASWQCRSAVATPYYLR